MVTPLALVGTREPDGVRTLDLTGRGVAEKLRTLLDERLVRPCLE